MFEALVAEISSALCRVVRTINRKHWLLPVAIIATVFVGW